MLADVPSSGSEQGGTSSKVNLYRGVGNPKKTCHQSKSREKTFRVERGRELQCHMKVSIN